MNILIKTIIFLLLIGCNKPVQENTKVSRSAEMQEEINILLEKDAENKKLELEYLEQIRIAQENNDTEAFEFYFQEYVGIERLKIPDWMKKEPNYVQGGLKVKY
tara:strand:+ start:706 stop:1017 length:312 start_codon:yes stop_codon:yes gene_type:complete